MNQAEPEQSKQGSFLMEVRNVSKSFGVVRALDDVSITVNRNEIFGVVGENGAGKTTLMKTLVGIHEPDQGEWIAQDQAVSFPKDPKEAARRGISIVYQEKGVIPSLQVYQFLFLGHENQGYSGPGGLKKRLMKKSARDILDEFGINCNETDYMYDLPLAAQKMIEIAKAVLSIRLEQNNRRGDSIIVLDEPTAPLTIEQRQELLKEICRMKKNTSFIFVTHIMQEVMEFMDRVYVLRDGRLVRHYNMAKETVTEEDLTEVIIGRQLLETEKETAEGKIVESEIMLSLDKISKKGAFYDVSFSLHKGECLGIFGPEGSGKSEVIKSIAGIVGFDSGTLSIGNNSTKPRESAHTRLRKGVGYFSGNTDNELFHDWPIRKNITLLNIGKIKTRYIPLLSFKKERELAQKIHRELRIKAPGINTMLSSLSGGNKQKVTVGKWMEKSPRVLLLEDPTKGIDVGSRADIYKTILGMKKQGTSMVLVGDDPKEYGTLCDRIILMKKGVVQEIISRRKFREVVET